MSNMTMTKEVSLPSPSTSEAPMDFDEDTRVLNMIASLRHRQLELALRGSIRESARIAKHVKRLRRAMQV